MEQATNVEKGLLQGEALKDYAQKLIFENGVLSEIIKKDNLLITSLKAENGRLADLVSLNIQYAEQDKEQDGFMFRRVLRGDKNRWGVSGIAGYGLASNFTLMPIVGLGVSYDIWRF